MKLAIYPGSFDPVTNGHLDIIDRAASLFDQVIVAVSVNSGKHPLFTLEERKKMLHEVVKFYKNVTIDGFEGLTVEYTAKIFALNFFLQLEVQTRLYNRPEMPLL